MFIVHKISNIYCSSWGTTDTQQIGELTYTMNWGALAHSYQLGKSNTSGTGEVSYTATNRGTYTLGTYTHWELGNFKRQLLIWELTHTGNWGTFIQSYQLGNLHTLETGKRSYTTTNWGTQTHRELSNFHTQLPIGELTHNGNWGTFIHSYQL